MVIGPDQRLVLDEDTDVAGIIINGAALLVEDTHDTERPTDYQQVVKMTRTCITSLLRWRGMTLWRMLM